MTPNPPAARARPAGQDATDASELASDILRKTTSLLLSGPRPHAAEQLDLYDGIFARLMPQVAAERLAEFSAALASLERAPYATARQLAAHGEVRVAAPILAKAAVLTERDLTEIIKTASQSHLVAIAIRRQLPETLSDLLVARGLPAVRMALAKNLTARFSEDTYRSLFKSAERDEELAEKLGSRTDLPAKASRSFVAVASEAARARFIKAAPPAAQASLHAVPIRSPAAAMRASWDYSHIKAEIAALNRTGKLRDSAVNRFVHSGDFPAAIFSLAVLSDVAVEVIEALMDDDRRDDLLVACKASRLSWATTAMILRGRPGCAPVPPDELEEERIRFEKLVLSEAQWKVRSAIKVN